MVIPFPSHLFPFSSTFPFPFTRESSFGAHGTAASTFFSNGVINRWNQLDQRVVDASSINAFKGCLNKIRETRMGFFMD